MEEYIYDNATTAKKKKKKKKKKVDNQTFDNEEARMIQEQ